MKKPILVFLLMHSFVFQSYTQVSGDNFSSLMDALIDGINTGMASRGSAGEMGNVLPTLSLSECVPDFNQDMSQEVVLSCNEEPICIECFEKAYDKLNFYRRQLARLRCIYNNTKTYKENAVAFGDNTSGIHAMAGIAWQQQRAIIMKSYQRTQQTYDTKSTEFLTGLQATLQELNTCMYISGENNWYVKSGFIYFEFMQERYKRND